MWSDEENEHLLLFSPSDAGRLIHLRHSAALGYGTLHARACCTTPIAQMRELVTETSERVINAIACWIFSGAFARAAP